MARTRPCTRSAARHRQAVLSQRTTRFAAAVLASTGPLPVAAPSTSGKPVHRTTERPAPRRITTK